MVKKKNYKLNETVSEKCNRLLISQKEITLFQVTRKLIKVSIENEKEEEEINF